MKRSHQTSSTVPSQFLTGLRGPQGDDPKTSEYAYFKKLKKDASRSFCPLLKEDDQLKKFETIECCRDTKNMGNDSSKDLKSSLHINEFTPSNFDFSFLSPHKGALKNSDVGLKEACTSLGDTCSILKNTGERGTQCIYEEAFSRKRHKLRQWVDASFPEIDIGCSKGYDFISVLLSRLSPVTSENKSCKGQKLQPVEVDTKSESLALSKSDMCSNKLQYSSMQNFRELESGPCLNYGSSFCQIDKSEEKLRWKWNLGSDHPTCQPSKFHLQCQKEKPDCDLDGEGSACLWTENHSTSGFSFKKYGLVESSHLKEVDEFHDQKEQMLRREPHSLLLDWDFDKMKGDKISSISSPNMELNMDSMLPMFRREPHSLMLDWDFDNMKGDKILSIASPNMELNMDSMLPMFRREPHSLLLDWDFDNMKGDKIFGIASSNMEPNMDSTLPISKADNYWHSGDYRFDASVLFPSSLLSCTSLAHSYSDCYYNYDHGQHSVEERKCLIAKLHHFPLTFSYCHNPTEDCTYDNSCKDGSIVCSPQDCHWSMSMSFNEKHHFDLEALLLSSRFDFDLRQKHLLLADYPGEHYSSAYQALQFLQKERICSHYVEDESMSWLDDSNNEETLVHFPGDVLNICDWSSINLLMSLNKEKAYPLLLDKSIWAASEAEMDIDDCEGKHT